MVLTASLMAPNAFATSGSLISTSAVTNGDGKPDRRLPQRDRAAVFAERPRDRQQRQHAERRLQLQHDPETPLGRLWQRRSCKRNAGQPIVCRPLTTPPGRPRRNQQQRSGAADGSRFEKQETGQAMSSMMPVGAGALLKHRSFLLFLLSRSFSRFASQIGGRRDRLADLRPDRQRLRSRHGRAGAIPADGAAGVRRRPRRRPLRAQARGADLPDRRSG